MFICLSKCICISQILQRLPTPIQWLRGVDPGELDGEAGGEQDRQGCLNLRLIDSQACDEGDGDDNWR